MNCTWTNGTTCLHVCGWCLTAACCIILYISLHIISLERAAKKKKRGHSCQIMRLNSTYRLWISVFPSIITSLISAADRSITSLHLHTGVSSKCILLQHRAKLVWEAHEKSDFGIKRGHFILATRTIIRWDWELVQVCSPTFSLWVNLSAASSGRLSRWVTVCRVGAGRVYKASLERSEVPRSRGGRVVDDVDPVSAL